MVGQARAGRRSGLPNVCSAPSPVRIAAPGTNGQRSQRVEVDGGAQRRVDGVEDLEAAVEPEPVDDVGRDAAAGPVGGVEHRDVEPAPREHGGGAQAGEPGADDHHVVSVMRGRRGERVAEAQVPELVPGLLQLGGHGALAVQQQLLAHRAEHALDRERRDGDRRRPVHASARAFVNSAFVTGVGPVRLTGPRTASCSSACRMPPTSSSSEIHGMYWVPDPSRRRGTT